MHLQILFLKVKHQIEVLLDKFAKKLNMHDNRSLNSLKALWEEDMGVEISDPLRLKGLDRMHSSSICMRHISIQFKIVQKLN